jgi:hypothetical protein
MKAQMRAQIENVKNWLLGMTSNLSARMREQEGLVPDWQKCEPVPCQSPRLANLELIPVITIPLKPYLDLVDGVEAMGDRPPTSRAEWMARDLVAAVQLPDEQREPEPPYEQDISVILCAMCAKQVGMSIDGGVLDLTEEYAHVKDMDFNEVGEFSQFAERFTEVTHRCGNAVNCKGYHPERDGGQHE